MIKVKDASEMPESIGGVVSDERETVIRKDYADGKAHICTTDCVEYRKLMRRCAENPAKWKAVGYETNAGEPQVGYFECPSRLVRYGSGKEAALTPEQRRERAERLRAGAAKAKGDPE